MTSSIVTPARDGGFAAHVTPDAAPTLSLSKGASSDCGDGPEVAEPTVNDVLCGRGGSINAHPGNERFRTLVEKRKRVYLTARFKREKRLIASSIVSEIRALDPPGRFLTKNSKTGQWVDIGDEKARDKTSQALRENAPTLRAEIETEICEQRAEMQSATPQPPPPAVAYYAWPYPYPPYYGYAQPPPPPQHSGQPATSPYSAAQQLPTAQPQAPFAQHPSGAQHPAYPPPAQWNAGGTTSPHSEQQQLPYGVAVNPYTNAQQPQQQQQQDDDDDKSIFDQTFESLGESLASWAKTFRITGGASVSSNHDDRLETASQASKPIVYVHQPEEDLPPRNRAVHFKDDSSASSHKPPRILQRSHINYPKRPKRNRPGVFGSGSSQNGGQQQQPQQQQQRPGIAPISTVQCNENDGMISLITTEGMNSIVEEGPLYDMGGDFVDHTRNKMHSHPNESGYTYTDCEPEPIVPILRKRLGPRRASSIATDDASSSMFEQVANQIVMGVDSLDTSGLCTSDALALPVPKEVTQDRDTMAVEIEGQEVQLVDMMDQDPQPYVDPRDHRRRAPDDSRLPSPDKQRMEMDWPSRIGSCHSWIPESLGATSLFSANSRQGSHLSPESSMDMDVSTATDHYSFGGSIGGTSLMGGSIGGASLCKVFDAETPGRGDSVAQGLPSPDMSSRVLAQVPSWEHHLRNRSPFSLGSDEEDDQSLMTKGSDKLMGGSISSNSKDENNNANTDESHQDDNADG